MRTQMSGVSKAAVRFYVMFETYRGEVGNEYVSAYTTSGAVFDTEDEALAGGARALDCLEKTGKFPNMCDYF